MLERKEVADDEQYPLTSGQENPTVGSPTSNEEDDFMLPIGAAVGGVVVCITVAMAYRQYLKICERNRSEEAKGDCASFFTLPSTSQQDVNYADQSKKSNFSAMSIFESNLSPFQQGPVKIKKEKAAAMKIHPLPRGQSAGYILDRV